LFLIIFCETGLVIAPFLPGDSLLFVAGALWANAGMDAPLLAACLISAAVLGDNCNYFIGRWLGPRVFRWENSRLFNQRALVYTQQFYERHGGKTVMMARWLPLVRTFAPFVAGVGRMHYARFVSFSVIGSIVWVGVLVALGWYFGNLPWVKKNLSLVIVAIIAISLLPMLWAFVRQRFFPRAGTAKDE
jgi:membrane-associated protein